MAVGFVVTKFFRSIFCTGGLFLDLLIKCTLEMLEQLEKLD